MEHLLIYQGQRPQYSCDWLRTTYPIAYHQVLPGRNCSLEPCRCLRLKCRDNPRLSLREPQHPLLPKHISTLGPSCSRNLASYRLCVRSGSPLNVCRGNSPLTTSQDPCPQGKARWLKHKRATVPSIARVRELHPTCNCRSKPLWVTLCSPSRMDSTYW